MQIRFGHGHLASLCLMLTASGCSSSMGPVPIPDVNSDAGQAAVRQYDSDGDQAIGEAELAKSPGLKSAMARIDKDNNKKMSADEINQRVSAWRNSRVGVAQCTVTVRQQGRPLENAQVKFIPEKFLGESLSIAQGVTNGRGMAPMKISEEPDGVGAHLAFYRVEISKIVDGKETIPAKYNSNSELGLELAIDVFESSSPIFDLQSR
jgi:hypothetical protein